MNKWNGKKDLTSIWGQCVFIFHDFSLSLFRCECENDHWFLVPVVSVSRSLCGNRDFGHSLSFPSQSPVCFSPVQLKNSPEANRFQPAFLPHEFSRRLHGKREVRTLLMGFVWMQVPKGSPMAQEVVSMRNQSSFWQFPKYISLFSCPTS